MPGRFERMATGTASYELADRWHRLRQSGRSGADAHQQASVSALLLKAASDRCATGDLCSVQTALTALVGHRRAALQLARAARVCACGQRP